MLRNLAVRSKLLVVLAVPLTLLLAASGFLVLQATGEARGADRVRQLTEVSALLDDVVHDVQAERSATVAWLGDGTTDNRAAVETQRAEVDNSLGRLREAVAEAPVGEVSPAVAEGVARASARHDALAGIRAEADAVGTTAPGNADAATTAAAADAAAAVTAAYDSVVAADLQLPVLVAQAASDDELAAALRAYASLSEVIEQSFQERDLLSTALRTGSLERPEFLALAGTVAQQDSALRAYTSHATAEQIQRLDSALETVDTDAVDAARGLGQDLFVDSPGPTDPAQWLAVSAERIDALVSVEGSLVQDAAAIAAAQVDEAHRRAALLTAGAVLAFGLALLIALVSARRMVQPLRRLTEAATATAEELPTLVATMQVPGSAPELRSRTIPVTSRDEIGRLAEAFNAVNEVTVRVAHEQAALRASIAEMFVNVARRNQVLLGRQLSFIDQLEAHEEDPDTLQNLFRLDHLATRMRRNAESLLVLAGVDATRRLRSPLPLSDVVRTAVSEIEHYDRVDLAVDQDPRVTGRLALTVAHLLAELLENATHFSDPDTRVVVVTAPGVGGVDVEVTDRGLGMSEEDIEHANATIADPPVAEIAVAQRLGLYVVGRIAQRLGATVVLRRGAESGTVVTVTLPAGVFDDEVITLPSREGTDGRTSTAPDQGRREQATSSPTDADDPVTSGDRHRAAVTTSPVIIPPVPAGTVAPTEPAPASARTAATPNRPAPSVVEPTPALTETPPPRAAVFGSAIDVLPGRTPGRSAGRAAGRGTGHGTGAEPGRKTRDRAGAPGAPPDRDARRGAGLLRRRGDARDRSAPGVSAARELAPSAPTPPAPTAAGPPAPAPTPQGLTPPGPTAPGSTPPGHTPPAGPGAGAGAGLASSARSSWSLPVGPPVGAAQALPVGPAFGSTAAAESRQAALPSRRGAGEPEVAPAAAAAVPAIPDLDQLAATSRLQSEALSELSRLYSPSYTPTRAVERDGLLRRTPRPPEPTTAAPETAPADDAPGGDSRRTAAEVRGMLSGFRAGVERGRTSSADPAGALPDQPQPALQPPSPSSQS